MYGPIIITWCMNEHMSALLVTTGGLDDNFTCPEGKVLPLDKVCNTIPDCKNAEDENECMLSEEDKTLLEDYEDLLFGDSDSVANVVDSDSVVVDSLADDSVVDEEFTMDDGLDDVEGEEEEEEDGSDWFSY